MTGLKIKFDLHSIPELQSNIQLSVRYIRCGRIKEGLLNLIRIEWGEDHIFLELLFGQLYILWGELAKNKCYDKKVEEIEVKRKYINEQYDPNKTFEGYECLEFEKKFLLFFRIEIFSEQRRADGLYKHFVSLYFMGWMIFSTFWRTGENNEYDSKRKPFYDKD